MSILDRQRQLVQLGRIRCGESRPGKNGGKQPVKLDHFKFSSDHKDMIDQIAAIYGGQVVPFTEEKWAVVVEADEIDVWVAPREPMEYYELWAASGKSCTRRCDGDTEQLSGQPCICKVQQQFGKKGACEAWGRYWFMLPKIVGLGSWRLDTKGYYAQVELGGAMDWLLQAARQGRRVDAKLALQSRERTVGGVKRSWYTPVLIVQQTLEATMGNALSAPNQGAPVLPSPEPVLADEDGVIPETQDPKEAAREIIRALQLSEDQVLELKSKLMAKHIADFAGWIVAAHTAGDRGFMDLLRRVVAQPVIEDPFAEQLTLPGPEDN